jgi:hypothetical protein
MVWRQGRSLCWGAYEDNPEDVVFVTTSREAAYAAMLLLTGLCEYELKLARQKALSGR